MPLKQVEILGVNVNSLTMAQAVEAVQQFIAEKKVALVATANAEMLMRSTQDEELKDILNQADLVVPDGAGTVWAAGHLGEPMPERVAGFDLAQELRATTLRMEQFISRQAWQLQQQVNSKLLEINSELPISQRDVAYECGMEYDTAFKDTDRKIFKEPLSIYKNPKSFFEQGGTREMEAALEKIFDRLADEYLHAQQERLLSSLHEGTEQVFARVKERLERILQANYEANLAALEGGVPAEVMEEILAELEKQA